MSNILGLNELMSQYQTVKETLSSAESTLSYVFSTAYGLSIKKLSKNLDCLPYLKDSDKNIRDTINSLTEEEFNTLLNNIGDSCTDEHDLFMDKVYGTDKSSMNLNVFKTEEDSTSNPVENLIKILEEYEKEMEDISNMKNEMKAIDKDIHKANEEYFNYINSDEYIQKKQEEVNELKAKLSTLEGVDKSRLEKNIATIEKVIEGTCIFNRLIDENGVVNENEVKSITRAFFDPNISRIVMNKYTSKCKKLGLDPSMYKSLFNIEEIISNTTGRDLYCYNNIILFHWMRLVAYCNVDDKNDNMIISEYIKFMIKIVNNKYANDSDRERVINNVARFCEIFEDCGYREKYEVANKLSPKHESRRKSDLEHKTKYVNEYNELLLQYKSKVDNCEFTEMKIEDTEKMTIQQVYSKVCELQKEIDNLYN